MKIRLSSPPQPVDVNSRQVSDAVIDNSIRESRWQKGIITFQGKQYEGSRLMQLGEYSYRLGETDVGEPEAFMPTEFMGWRDS